MQKEHPKYSVNPNSNPNVILYAPGGSNSWKNPSWQRMCLLFLPETSYRARVPAQADRRANTHILSWWWKQSMNNRDTIIHTYSHLHYIYTPSRCCLTRLLTIKTVITWTARQLLGQIAENMTHAKLARNTNWKPQQLYIYRPTMYFYYTV